MDCAAPDGQRACARSSSAQPSAARAGVPKPLTCAKASNDIAMASPRSARSSKASTAGRQSSDSFFAKRARGLMARWAVQQRLANVAKLERFDAEGYAFDAAASSADRLVFRRRVA